MKKLITILVVILIINVFICPVKAQNWGNWTQSTCYKGIYHRASKSEYGRWVIQFKNTYLENNDAHFSWEVYSDRSCTKYISLNNRSTCAKQGTIEIGLGEYAYLSQIWVVVKDLRFAETEYEDNGEYYKCDK